MINPGTVCYVTGEYLDSLVAGPHAPLVPVHVVWEVLTLVLAQAVDLVRVQVRGNLQELVRQNQATD